MDIAIEPTPPDEADELAPAQRRGRRRRQIQDLAAVSDGVASRRQLYGAGLTRWEVKAEIRSGRWRRLGRQCVLTHSGDLGDVGRMWWAALENGPSAVVDGVTSLQAAGLVGYEDPIHIAVPKGARRCRLAGVIRHETRRLQRDDVVGTGLPRTRPAVAAVRGALWARSDRQAALVFAMAVQQRITTAEAIGVELVKVKRHKRRRFLITVLADVGNGAQSMGELDFTRMCRERGFPEPSRQVMRQGPGGRVYLDVHWVRWQVTVEIEGAHHLDPEAAVPDAIRQNDVSLRDGVVLRLPVLGLRADPDAFFAQIARALVARGHNVLRPEGNRPRSAGRKG